MYLLLHFLCVLLLFHIGNGDSRRDMQEDIKNTNLQKIHEYNPAKRNKERGAMNFDKDFPVSKFIINSLRRVLDAIKDHALLNLRHKIKHKDLRGDINLSNFTKALLVDTVHESVAATLNGIAPLTTNPTRRELYGTNEHFNSQHKQLKNLIRLLRKELRDADNAIGGRMFTDGIRPGYCYIFGICSSLFCQCP